MKKKIFKKKINKYVSFKREIKVDCKTKNYIGLNFDVNVIKSDTLLVWFGWPAFRCCGKDITRRYLKGWIGRDVVWGDKIIVMEMV